MYKFRIVFTRDNHSCENAVEHHMAQFWQQLCVINGHLMLYLFLIQEIIYTWQKQAFVAQTEN